MFKKYNLKIFEILNNLKIWQKLIILYVCTFLLPLLGISLGMSSWLYSRLLSDELIRSTDVLHQTESVYGDMLENIAELSNRLYVNDTLREIAQKKYDTTVDVVNDYNVFQKITKTSFLDDFLLAYRDIASIRLYVDNDTLLDNSYFVKLTSDIANQQWYTNAVADQGVRSWVIKTDEITQKKHLSLVRSMWESSVTHGRTLVGVLVINLHSNRISRLLESHQFETLIMLDGKIVYPVDKYFIGEEISFITPEVKTSSTTVFLEKVILHGEPISVFISNFSPQRGNTARKFQVMNIIPMEDLQYSASRIVAGCVLFLLAGGLMSILFIWLFSQYFAKRANQVRTSIKKVVSHNFEIQPSIGGADEFSEIYDALYDTTENIKKLIDEVYMRQVEKEKLLSRQNDIKFKMLSTQINPHFLFNTLETIRMQAVASGDKQVAGTIKLLAKILRHSLSVLNKPVSLFSELESINNYLDIQHIRFADRVSYDIIPMCDTHKLCILPLLIQPLIENSFSHGLEQTIQGGFIWITASTENNILNIEVRDSGAGMKPEVLEDLQKKIESTDAETLSSSIGLVNVYQRIKLFYGDDYGLTITSGTEGTTVRLKLPVQYLEEGDPECLKS